MDLELDEDTDKYEFKEVRLEENNTTEKETAPSIEEQKKQRAEWDQKRVRDSMEREKNFKAKEVVEKKRVSHSKSREKKGRSVEERDLKTDGKYNTIQAPQQQTTDANYPSNYFLFYFLIFSRPSKSFTYF